MRALRRTAEALPVLSRRFPFGLYGAGLAVAAATLWTGAVHPLMHAPSFGAVMDWLERLDGLALVMLVVPGPAAALLAMLWFEVATAGVKHLGSGDRRRRAESDLHGHARLLGRRFLRRLAKRRGILLGQWGGGGRAPLIGWSLEGSAITVAPPRTGKGATIALNLLSPDDRGFDGSTVTIDPTGGWRGHIWEQYGRTIVDCAAEAMRTDAEIDCPLVVRRP